MLGASDPIRNALGLCWFCVGCNVFRVALATDRNATAGDLFFHIWKYISCKKPKAFILENVASLASAFPGIFDMMIGTLRDLRGDEGETFYEVHWEILDAVSRSPPASEFERCSSGLRGRADSLAAKLPSLAFSVTPNDSKSSVSSCLVPARCASSTAVYPDTALNSAGGGNGRNTCRTRVSTAGFRNTDPGSSLSGCPRGAWRSPSGGPKRVLASSPWPTSSSRTRATSTRRCATYRLPRRSARRDHEQQMHREYNQIWVCVSEVCFVVLAQLRAGSLDMSGSAF